MLLGIKLRGLLAKVGPSQILVSKRWFNYKHKKDSLYSLSGELNTLKDSNNQHQKPLLSSFRRGKIINNYNFDLFIPKSGINFNIELNANQAEIVTIKEMYI